LTHVGNERYLTYVERACQNPIARAVKLYDMLDNLSRLHDLANAVPEQDIRRMRNKYNGALKLVLGYVIKEE